MKYINHLIILALAFMLAACAPDISANSYSYGSVGQAAPTGRGVIIGATPVRVSGTSGIGALAGGVAGAAAGSQIGGNTAMNIVGGVGGALVGGLIGNAVEGAATQQTAMQYQIQMLSGRVVTVTQGMNPPLGVGQHVFVVFGSPARVIPDNGVGY